jgi:glucose-1-phosphate thymidylyltransferase
MEKGVILAGGRGVRLQSFTCVSNKHLAPVYSDEGATPMIYYPIRTLVNSGIKEILIISSQEHSGDIIEYLGDGSKFNAEFTYKIQDMHKTVGIAAALKIAQSFTKDESFAVILGDNYYEDSFSEEISQFSRSKNHACIFLKEVSDIHRFGCATLGINGEVTKIVEKPKTPESNLAVTGLYLYTSNVYTVINTLIPSNRGELEVSDINHHYACDKRLASNVVKGFWSDMGTPNSMLHTQEHLNKHA